MTTSAAEDVRRDASIHVGYRVQGRLLELLRDEQRRRGLPPGRGKGNGCSRIGREALEAYLTCLGSDEPGGEQPVALSRDERQLLRDFRACAGRSAAGAESLLSLARLVASRAELREVIDLLCELVLRLTGARSSPTDERPA